MDNNKNELIINILKIAFFYSIFAAVIGIFYSLGSYGVISNVPEIFYGIYLSFFLSMFTISIIFLYSMLKYNSKIFYKSLGFLSAGMFFDIGSNLLLTTMFSTTDFYLILPLLSAIFCIIFLYIKKYNYKGSFNSKFRKAINFHENGDYEQAFNLYKELEKENHDYPKLYTNLATIFYNQKEDYENVIKYSNKALAIQPNFTNAFYGKMYALELLGRYDEALETVDDLLKINEKSVVAWTFKGNVLISLGRYDDAIKCFDRSLKLDSKDSEIYRRKAYALLELKDFEKALKCVDEGLKIDSKNLLLYHFKSFLLMELKVYDESLAAFNKSLSLNPNGKLLINLLDGKREVLEKLGNKKEALNILNKILKYCNNFLRENPNNSEILYSKAYSLANLHKFEDSLDCLDKLLEIDSKYYKAWTLKGYVLYKIKRWDESLKALNKSLELNNTSLDAFNNKALVLLKLNCFDKALNVVDEALKLPDDKGYMYEILHTKASILEKMDKLHESLEFYDRALKIESNDEELIEDRNNLLKKLNMK